MPAETAFRVFAGTLRRQLVFRHANGLNSNANFGL